MNADNRTTAVSEELDHAARCVVQARALRALGHPDAVLSRAYYAVFHAARALLVSLGLEVKSHRAVLNQVSEHFVKTGRLEPELARLLARMQRDREDADYEMSAVFTDSMAEQAIGDAERFLAAVRTLLA
jgi:uncharacterized protein (UPF0332 family)